MTKVFAIPDKDMIEQKRMRELSAKICNADELFLEVPAEKWLTKGKFHQSAPSQFIYARPTGRFH